jgi:hypothetical protein
VVVTTPTLLLLAAHAAGDFPLQTDRMAAGKFDGPTARSAHVAVYTAAFLPVVWLLGWPAVRSVVFLAVLAATHYAIDSRRWAEPKERFESYPIALDQALHVIALAGAVVVSSWVVAP